MKVASVDFVGAPRGKQLGEAVVSVDGVYSDRTELYCNAWI